MPTILTTDEERDVDARHGNEAKAPQRPMPDGDLMIAERG
jgi:hypothetical protein